MKLGLVHMSASSNSRQSKIKASIDSTSGRKNLYGYVIDLNDINREVHTIITIDDKKTLNVICNRFKETVSQQYGNGFHGFKIEIPSEFKDGKHHLVKLFSSESSNEIICESKILFSHLEQSENENTKHSTSTTENNNTSAKIITSNAKTGMSAKKVTLADAVRRNQKSSNEEYPITVSVVIAAYNCEDFIDQCIQSLINQTFRDFEIICVDDGSTDSTLAKLKDYESKYDYIHVYTQKNQYAGVARNHGMKYARGEYLLFLDSDDFFEPNLLELTTEAALQNDAEIVVFGGQEYDCITQQYSPCKFPVSPSLFPTEKKVISNQDFGEKLFQANSCLAWNKLIKHSFAKEHGIKFGNTKSSNDTVFVYTLLSLAEKIVLVNKVLVNYRVNNPKSLQRSKANHWETLLLAFFALKKEMIKFKTYEKHKRSFVNKILQAVCYYLSTIDENTQKVMKSSLTNKYFRLLDLVNIEPKYIYNKNFYNQWVQINQKTYIPVVYASNSDYVPYMSVSIQSAMENVSADTILIFYVLIDDEFKESDCEILQNQVRNSGHEIRFIKANEYFKNNLKSRIEHISIQTFYRLAIPSLLSYYNKVIYIDGDTVVNGDIKDLYSIDINDSYICGVVAPAFVNKKHVSRLGIDTKNYINAGVILINNRLLIKDKVQEKFMDAIGKNYDCMDQDILNVVCSGKIKNIDLKYNLMTKYFSNYEKYLDKWNISCEDFKNKIINPHIIHYADKIKPWNDSKSPLASYFYMYTINTPYCEFFKNIYKEAHSE